MLKVPGLLPPESESMDAVFLATSLQEPRCLSAALGGSSEGWSEGKGTPGEENVQVFGRSG